MRDQPGWITFSLDGKHAYPSTGEVIDIATRKIYAPHGRTGPSRAQREDGRGNLRRRPAGARTATSSAWGGSGRSSRTAAGTMRRRCPRVEVVIAPDGKRFLLVVPGVLAQGQIVVVVNCSAELTKLVPTR